MAYPADATPIYLLLDLGKVVVDWDPLRLYGTIFSSRREAEWFCANVCTLKWHTAHDRGVPMSDNSAPLIAQFPHYEDAIRAWQSRWLDMFDGYVAGMPELLTRLLEQDAPLYALSNLPAEVSHQTFVAHPLINEFRDVIVSGEEGVVKPDPEIYKIALARMGNPEPRNVLFVDDRKENVDAADKLGFRTHLFESANVLSAHLEALRIL